MSTFDINKIRSQFPALNQVVNGSVPVFLDGPGGTQVPERVLEAITGYLGYSNSNQFDSPFFAVQKTHEIIQEARERAAAFVNAENPSELIFGPNMSSLTNHFARSISREWQEGDEIIVTALDHYANVSFWRNVAEDRGVTCHSVNIHPEDCTLDYDHLESLISNKTKLVAFTLASNVCGSQTDSKRVIEIAKAVGALTYVDSVHYAPHFLPDVKDLDCDFLACSAYKFCGPHLGFVYGKLEHLEHFQPYKLEPAPKSPPECWEIGTKSFEALAGFNAQIDYLSSFSNNSNLRSKLKVFYEDMAGYEQDWSRAFLERSEGIPNMKIYGIKDPNKLDQRTSTFAFTIEGHSSQAISDHLARENISTGSGNFYGVGVTDALGLTKKGGVVRAGCFHYNTLEELDRLFGALGQL